MDLKISSLKTTYDKEKGRGNKMFIDKETGAKIKHCRECFTITTISKTEAELIVKVLNKGMPRKQNEKDILARLSVKLENSL